MLLIEHYVASSPIHGLGVFAAVGVGKGALVWEFNPLIDRMIPEQALPSLPAHVQALVDQRGEYYPEWRCYVLGGDGDVFMNHSEAPNVVNDPQRQHRGLAARDIAPGEELTCDYRETMTGTRAGRVDPMRALAGQE